MYGIKHVIIKKHICDYPRIHVIIYRYYIPGFKKI